MRLHCPKGTSLVEIISILAILALVLSCVVPIGMQRINRAKYEKTITEMTSIAEASVDFYNSNTNTWPSNAGQLVPGYMFQLPTANPWNEDGYHLSHQNNLIMVSTNIPSGIAQQIPEGQFLNINRGTMVDTISIAQNIPMETTGRLLDEKNVDD